MNSIEVLQIGGGAGSLIGPAHRIAMQMDGAFRVAGGVFSRSAAKNRQAAQDLGLDPARTYASVEEMLAQDPAQVISICTPNDAHFAQCRLALEAGRHVICDKPLTTSSEQTRELIALAARQKKLLGVTYNYSGYPLVHEARHRIADGQIGAVHLIQGEFPQAFLSALKAQLAAGADVPHGLAWRTDPQQSGGSLVVLDLATHLFHLLEFVTGLEITAVSATVDQLNNALGDGGGADDNMFVTCTFSNGARGQLWASAVATGNEHGLSFGVYGDKGGLAWSQDEPNHLALQQPDCTHIRLHRGSADACAATRARTRFNGHPEGYFEAFANIYNDFAAAIRAMDAGDPVPEYISGEAGLRGALITEAVLRSSQAGSDWTEV